MAFGMRFNQEKNELLKVTRGVCFDDVLQAIASGKVLADMDHPSILRLKQKIFVVEMGGYAYVVPYVINKDKNEIFLKTAYSSRAMTKKYIKEGKK